MNYRSMNNLLYHKSISGISLEKIPVYNMVICYEHEKIIENFIVKC